MTQKELNKVLERHLHWLRKDCAGWENMRAILDGENLDRLDLRSASLNWASLEGASLNGASLNYTSLYKASFKRASLDGVSFYKASIEEALFYKASIEGASFFKASIEGVIDFPFLPFACPETGSFIGWKKVSNKIIKLEIPADAKRCSTASSSCKCDKAKVLEIQEINGNISDITKIRSDYDISFIYEVGKTVSVKDFCDDRWRDFGQGIHFFINRQSAVEY